MKTFICTAVLVAALCISAYAYADGNDPTTLPSATPVALISSQASTLCVTANAAAGAQATVTVNAGPAGQFFYVTLIESSYSAIAAPAATLMATTSTNIPTSFSTSQPMQAAVGDHRVIYPFGVPMKTTTAATATTLVGNAGVTSISQSLKMCGFYAK